VANAASETLWLSSAVILEDSMDFLATGMPVAVTWQLPREVWCQCLMPAMQFWVLLMDS